MFNVYTTIRYSDRNLTTRSRAVMKPKRSNVLIKGHGAVFHAPITSHHHGTSIIQTSITSHNKHSDHFGKTSCILYQVYVSSVPKRAPRKRSRRSRRYPELPLSQSTAYISRARTIRSSTYCNSAPSTPAIVTRPLRPSPLSIFFSTVRFNLQ